MTYPERTVVTGAGLAGLRTVMSLRERGYPGRITLLGEEKRPPYDRPPLSKKVLTEPGPVLPEAGLPGAGLPGAGLPEAGLPEAVDPSLKADFGALDVDFRPAEAATGLSDGVVTTNHDKYAFDRLVITTGAVPIALPGPGPQRFLRTYDDALALRALLRPGLRLAIIGAGWIGAELATAAAAAGCAVTVVEAGPTPLAGALGTEIGARTAAWYEAAGVSLRTGVAVESVEPGGLALAGGEWLPGDEVVTAVGVRPAVGWLAGSGVLLGDGVVVDAGLRASLPGVFAAGDCASFWSRLFGTRMRIEHWDAALHAPGVAAANVLGGDEEYDPVPYFWSEQFGRMVQYVGHHGGGDRLVWRGDPAGERWSACWLDGARLTAVLAVGRPRDMVQGRRLIAARALVDADRVADPDIAVKDAAA
ncbi:MAG TPA: FAD-dependent oxidoreductase [Trebonia sp.]|nr:FAD-dependent oxidoreductase [Trebonia sp.]